MFKRSIFHSATLGRSDFTRTWVIVAGSETQNAYRVPKSNIPTFGAFYILYVVHVFVTGCEYLGVCAVVKAFDVRFNADDKNWWRNLVSGEQQRQENACEECKSLRVEAMTLAMQIIAAKKIEEEQAGGMDLDDHEEITAPRKELQRKKYDVDKRMRKHLLVVSDDHRCKDVPLLGALASESESDSESELDFTGVVAAPLSSSSRVVENSDSELPDPGEDSADLADSMDEHDLNPVCWRGIPKPVVRGGGMCSRSREGHGRIAVGDLAIIRIEDMDPDWGLARVLKIRKLSRSLCIHWLGSTRHSHSAKFQDMWLNKDGVGYPGKKKHRSHKAWTQDVRMSMVVDWKFELTKGRRITSAVLDFIQTNRAVKWRR